MPTLDVFENGMEGVHSTMSSSIHEMSFILAQFQLQEQVKKPLKNNENSEKQWKTTEAPTLDPSLHLGSPNNELSFKLHFLVQTNWISLQNGAM